MSIASALVDQWEREQEYPELIKKIDEAQKIVIEMFGEEPKSISAQQLLSLLRELRETV